LIILAGATRTKRDNIVQQQTSIWIRTPAVIAGMALLAVFCRPAPSFSLEPQNISVTSRNETGVEYVPGSGLPVGKIMRSHDRVFVFHDRQSQALAAATGRPLYEGDRIVTADDARLICRLAGGARLIVAPATTMTVQPRGLDLHRDFGRVQVYLTRGQLRLNGSQPQDVKPGQMVVLTDGALIDARQSDIVMRTDGYSCEAVVLDGEPSRIAGRMTPNAVVRLAPGQRMVIVGGEIRSASENLSEERVEILRREFSEAPVSIPSQVEMDARAPADNAGTPTGNEELFERHR
jgi:hypothetical protein